MAASPYTLDGARKILTGPDDAWAGKLGALLGIGVLAAGPLGLAAGSATALAAWGWVDQKNELVGLLGKLVAAGRDRLHGKRSGERAEVLAATHTALVYGAFFAAIRETLGPVYDRIDPTDEDKRRLTERVHWAWSQADLERKFTGVHIRLPWAGNGFRATLDTSITPLYEDLAHACLGFLQGFAVWERVESVSPADALTHGIVERAARRYEAEYKSLAADVREFEIWAMLGEQEATRAVAERAGESLDRLEQLMISLSDGTQERTSHVRRTADAFNRAVLTEPLVSGGISDELPGLTVPAVGEGYLSPSFRWTVMEEGAKPADESWWARSANRESDLDTFLAAYFSAPRSHERPLVVLGHPGSGKSMFTKVCAARLSASDAFVAARIPLRKVPDPGVEIYQQVAAVLGTITNGRVSWAELSDASEHATRVLFIDGLDEFMQASGTSESNYLTNVVEFQRRESIASRPVAVVVTSRTLVADLARIPHGSLVLKLEDFTPDQVATWLDIWQAANPTGIPPAASVLSYGAVARQPLLLLLLVLHGVASGLPVMDEDSTPAQIYGGILRRFIRRELGKPTDYEPVGDEEAQTQAELWRLGIAAFGMFNRGKHYIEEQTLVEDLQALDQPSRQRPPGAQRGRALNSARRVLGKFFFIHASEADEGAEGRSYEFLHATFSEYLIAHFVLAELTELWLTRDRPSSQNWDDDRLYALLSHQLLDFGGASIVPFVDQLNAVASGASDLPQILRVLLREAGERWSEGRFGAYAPTSGSYVDRYATYTANLLLLLLNVTREPVLLSSIAPAHATDNKWWERLVRLWQGHLGAEFLDATIMLTKEPEPAIQKGWAGGQPVVTVDWLALSGLGAVAFNAGFGVMGNGLAIGSPDMEMHAMAQAARTYVDPRAYWAGNKVMLSLLHVDEKKKLHSYSVPLAATYLSRSPELFAAADVTALFSVLDEHLGWRDHWPIGLLLAQYPSLENGYGFVTEMLEQGSDKPAFTGLLAGALVWGSEWRWSERVLDAAPAELVDRAHRLHDALHDVASLIDPRRIVLILAESLLWTQPIGSDAAEETSGAEVGEP